MSSDVEMLPAQEKQGPKLIALRSRSPSPPRQSPITVDDDSAPSTPLPRPHSPSAGPSTSGVDESASAAAKEPKKKSKAPASARPSSTVASAKPKSTKSAPRSPSPSPPPPPARPPPQTIRLEIALGGPENYEVDIAQLSKESGQRPPTPVPVKRDSSDDSHSEGDDEGDGKQEKKKRRKKNIAQEYYDVSDPFIDDSELAVDERMYFAQTKQQGFYVSSGQVALLTDKPPAKKPKSKKVTILPPAASITAALSTASLPPLSVSNANASSSTLMSASTAKTANGVKSENGTRDSPISLYNDADMTTADSTGVNTHLKRKSSEADTEAEATRSPASVSWNKKKRKMMIKPFHPELQKMIDQLKAEIAQENWEVKGKFPTNLKPMLSQVALKAIIVGQYDDNFFNLMPAIFPYNRFTMMKLIKRTIWREHTGLLLERSNELLKGLEKLAQEGFPKAKEEWEKSVLAWEKRERAKADGAHATSAEGTPVPSDTQHTPPMLPGGLPHVSMDDGGNETSAEHEHEHDGEAAADDKAKGSAKEAHPPAKKYRLTDTMKSIIWQLVCLSNECCRIENEKNALENNNQIVSDQGVRKGLYQKIVACFPEGWITSGQVSREVSVMKKKYEKEQENE